MEKLILKEIGLDVEKFKYTQLFYDKKSMLMLGFKAMVKKANFVLSGEVDSAEWVQLDNALDKLRECGIA